VPLLENAAAPGENFTNVFTTAKTHFIAFCMPFWIPAVALQPDSNLNRYTELHFKPTSKDEVSCKFTYYFMGPWYQSLDPSVA
jgi:hypothetical protein